MGGHTAASIGADYFPQSFRPVLGQSKIDTAGANGDDVS